MLNVVVLVSGGGRIYRRLLTRWSLVRLPIRKIAGVISNNQNAYALERAKKHGYQAFVFLQNNFPPERNLMNSFWKSK